MIELETKITQLRDQTWELAGESLRSNELSISRTLTDIAEKLTSLLSKSEKSNKDTIKKGIIINIFARYQDRRYEAELNIDRIGDGIGKCVFMDGEWLSVSDAAIRIKINSLIPPKSPQTNGWNFWKYINESGKPQQIDRLRKQNTKNS